MSKNTNIIWVVILFAFVYSTACDNRQIEKESVDYVDPYIGNISHMLMPTYPTVHLPNSMMRIHPARQEVTDNKLKGLPLFLSGHRTELVFSLNPFREEEAPLQPYIDYNYDNEEIKPYYYSVYLDNIETEVKFAPSHQSAIYQFDFRNAGIPSIMLSTRKGKFTIKDNTVSGFEYIGGKHNTKVFLFLETEEMPENYYTDSVGGSQMVVFHFSSENKQVKIRYGISLISEEQAEKNLRREIQDFDINKIKDNGRKIWIEALDKFKVRGEEKDKTVFFTALYRIYERMFCISEDGRYYSGFDGQIHEDGGIPFYTDDWFWDTYRATHPLRSIIDPEKEGYMVNSMVRMAEQSENFWIPVFPEITGDLHSMNCNHGIAVILDSYRKGVRGFNLEDAYRAGKETITQKTLAPWSRGQKAGELDRFFAEKGYFPALNPGQEEYVKEIHSWERRQAVAVSLGTYYDEWCLAQIAKELSKSEDYKYFSDRSLNYRLLFNDETKFFHPKNAEGNFIEPFDYRFSGGLGARDYYDENNGWIYRWDVQHNIADLIGLMGGKQEFIEEIEGMFDTSLGKPKYEFFSQLPDHTGNVGQFSMANEPSLHIPYLYNYGGEAWRTQKRIRNLLDQWFRDDLMGMPGDEDGGGMSAFVVFSQLGFYPLTPGLPMYVIGSPVFEHSEIKLPDGKTFEIECINYSRANKYIQSAKLNGKEWTKSWFSHTDLMNGGTLELTMGKYANKLWATTPEDIPPSFEMKE